jgi:hypothetical protein
MRRVKYKCKGKNVKPFLYLMTHHAINTYGEVGRITSGILTSAIDRGGRSASRFVRLISGERDPCNHWIGGGMGPRADMKALQK